MSRFLAFTICFICFSSLADLFRPEIEYFHPNAPIIWAVTNTLPSAVEIYETVQTNFPKTTLSNAMAMASFKPIDMTSQGRDMTVFESRKKGVLVRCLRISQTRGSIDYFNSQTNWSSVHDVPSFNETKQLAFDYLSRFGGDTNQVSTKPSPQIKQTVETFDKRGGTMTNEAVSARGIMLCRAINGIDFSDSFLIEFGNDASITMLKMDWRYLKPHQQAKTLTKNEIIDAIKAGHAVVLPNMNGDDVSNHAGTFTITKATLIYRFQSAGTLVFPSVDLEMVTDIGKLNAATNYLECPFVPKMLAR